MPNELETALAKAFEAPGNIPAFLRLLVDSPVFVLVPRHTRIAMDEKTGEVVGLELARLTTRDGKQWVPFYSSEGYLENLPPKLKDLGMVKIMAGQLFKIIRGGQAVLNPNSDLTKAFEEDEIEAILAGIASGEGRMEMREVDGTMEFLHPSGMPREVVALLVRHCLKTPAILGAWIALKKMEGEQEASILLMLEVKGEFDAAAKSAGQSLASLPGQPPYMDIVPDQGDETSMAIKEHAIQIK